ncbi:MAG TPA: phenylacetate--CoA ligase, partial [Ruminiclostridium sp.]|nr:phenylacetate--CoA ligase [Ruminiclostridium sp.]
VEMNDTFFSDQVRKIENLERKLRQEIESAIGISAKIKLVERKSIQRSEGKAKRVIDKRKLF